MSNELKNIMTNGTYCLRFGMLQKEEQLVLKYFPTMPAQKSPQLLRQQSAENPVLNEPKLEPNIVAECWGKSKINNFVQKLGFLDSSQSDENGKLINAFRQLTNVSGAFIKFYKQSNNGIIILYFSFTYLFSLHTVYMKSLLL